MFIHSQQASETPQPGISNTSNAKDTTTLVVSSTTSKNVVKDVNTQESRLSAAQSPNPNPSSSNSKIKSEQTTSSSGKVVKVGSIFASNPQKSSSPASSSRTSESDSRKESAPIIIDKLALLTAWRSISSDNNIFDHATLMRIGSVEPVLIDSDHFEISVANPNVELFFKQNQSQIINALASHLQNKRMSMTIKIMSTSEPKKILSPYEQVNEMAEENPAFKKMKEIFQLSI